jgi:hypothetical protein
MDETKDETTGPRLQCRDRHANAARTISGDPKSTDSRTVVVVVRGYHWLPAAFAHANAHRL